MRVTKFFYIFVLCLLSSSCGNSQSEGESNGYLKQYEEAKVFYTEKYSTLTTTDQLKVEVDLLIAERKKNTGDVINEIGGTVLVRKILSFEASEPVRSARLMLLLYQYSGAEGSEGLTEILTERFYKNPSIVIDALTGIEGELLPEFRNEQFHKLLYKSSCAYPQSVTEAVDVDFEIENKKMRKRLEEIKTEENKKIIDYLLTQF